MTKLLLKCLLAALCVLIPAASFADYDVGGSEWNGLASLEELARSQGISLDFADSIDYRALEKEARPVVVLYPRQDMDVRSLARFVLDGGRVLVLDDFGQSDRLLERLEIRRVISSPGNLPHDEFANDNPALPVFRPSGRHPLLEGVETVVANHPSILSNPGGPVVGYSAGGALVYDMNLGEGKVVVVADASLVINQSLELADNAQFVSNALDYICANETRGECRPIVLVKEFEEVGIYERSFFDNESDVSSNIDGFNDAISELMDALPGSELLYYLSILMSIGLALYLVTVFPVRRTRAYSAYVSDYLGSIPQPQSEFDWNLSRFGQDDRNMNHALPLSILKEHFEELFLDDLGLWPSAPGERPDVSQLAKLYEEKYLSGKASGQRRSASSKTRDLLGLLARVPSRNRVFLDSEAHFSEADMLKIHRLAMETLRTMGLEDEYKRRTEPRV